MCSVIGFKGGGCTGVFVCLGYHQLPFLRLPHKGAAAATTTLDVCKHTHTHISRRFFFTLLANQRCSPCTLPVNPLQQASNQLHEVEATQAENQLLRRVVADQQNTLRAALARGLAAAAAAAAAGSDGGTGGSSSTDPAAAAAKEQQQQDLLSLQTAVAGLEFKAALVVNGGGSRMGGDALGELSEAAAAAAAAAVGGGSRDRKSVV